MFNLFLYQIPIPLGQTQMQRYGAAKGKLTLYCVNSLGEGGMNRLNALKFLI